MIPYYLLLCMQSPGGGGRLSQAGKSSLLRAIAGLWTCGDGEVPS